MPLSDEIAALLNDADYENYFNDLNNYEKIDWRQDPMPHWAFPVLGNHRYYIKFDTGVDFDQIKVEVNPWLWESSNSNDNVVLTFPHFDRRDKIVVMDNYEHEFQNATVGHDFDSWYPLAFGDNLH